jgi:hypothetical protein
VPLSALDGEGSFHGGVHSGIFGPGTGGGGGYGDTVWGGLGEEAGGGDRVCLRSRRMEFKEVEMVKLSDRLE